MGSGFLKQKKQAKAFKQQLNQMQEDFLSKLDSLEVTGSAGGNLVEITLNGSHEMKLIRIKPECVDPDDITGLETLIKAAYMDACTKIKEQSSAGDMPALSDLSLFGF